LTRAQIFEFFRRLAEDNPAPETELEYGNAYQLLVAVTLSAQATDVGVNKATRALFREVQTPRQMLALGEDGLKAHIKTIGLFNTKAKNVIAMAQRLVEHFGGEVPQSREALVTLPGVGRKTANVVRSVALDLPGFPVDTHVGRLVKRLDITQESDPVKVERIVDAMVPAAERGTFSLRLILHGRRVCIARKPACGACVLSDFCPSAGIAGR
jgi:endonuclease III